jgi:hypothetical protein
LALGLDRGQARHAALGRVLVAVKRHWTYSSAAAATLAVFARSQFVVMRSL